MQQWYTIMYFCIVSVISFYSVWLQVYNTMNMSLVRRISCVTGGCLVFTDTAEDCGILSGQCLCIWQQVFLHLLFQSGVYRTSVFSVIVCFSPTPYAVKIADKISEQCHNAVLLMVSLTFVTTPLHKTAFEKFLLLISKKTLCVRLMERRCFRAVVCLQSSCMSVKTPAGLSKTNTRKQMSTRAFLLLWFWEDFIY